MRPWFDGTVRVCVLGPLAVEVSAGRLHVRGQRPLDVLATLTQRHGREVPAEVLLDLVWGPKALELTPAAVHTVVARIRRTFGPELVHTGPSGYALAADVGIDAVDHDRLVHSARDLRSGGRLDEASRRYRQALALWAGPTAYTGVSDDLVVAERTRLEESRATATEELAAVLLETGRDADAEESLRLSTALMDCFSLREAPCRLAMRAAYVTGRQATALSLYAQLRRRLRDELGVDPTPETQALHRQILSQEDRLVITRPSAVTRSRGRAPLPATPTVGREPMVADLLDALDEGQRLLTLIGPGGVGKSRLLQEVSRRLDTHPTAYVDLSGCIGFSAEEIARTIALDNRLQLTGPDVVAALTAALGQARVIVLVDEAEWSAASTASIASAVLRRCPGVQLLVTSRVPLGLAGERLVPVSPLECPSPLASADQIHQAPAVHLLRDRLRDLAPDVRVDDEYEAMLAELARRVDGLPLGLELIAGSGATQSLHELADRLSSPLDLTNPGTDDDRHQSLRRAIGWSVERLTPSHRAALRHFAVFAGPFGADAAQAVHGGPDVAEALRTLAREAVIQLDRRGPRTRFHLLRIMRDLAAEDLEASGELAQTRRRHRQWYAGRWRNVPFHDEMLFDIGEGYDNYLLALRDALDAQDTDSVAGLGVSLGWYWVFHEASGNTSWLDRILALRGLTPADRARISTLYRALSGTFTPPAAGPTAAEARSVLAHDREWRVISGLVDVFADYVSGDLGRALDASEDLITLAAQGAPHHLPEVLATLAVMRAASGFMDAALTAAEEAWQLIGAAPGVIQLAAVVTKVGLALLDAGHPHRALAILTEAIDSLDRRLGATASPSLIINAGWAAVGCEDFGVAADWFGRALGQPPGVVGGNLAEAASGAATVLLRLAVPDAASHAGAAAELCRRHGVDLSPWVVTALDRFATQDDSGDQESTPVLMRDDELAAPIIAALTEVTARTHPQVGLDT